MYGNRRGGYWNEMDRPAQGGTVEKWAIRIYWIMIAAIVVGKLISYEVARPRVTLPEAQADALLAQAHHLVDTFNVRSTTATHMEVADLRNQLVDLREKLNGNEPQRTVVDHRLAASIGAVLDRMRDAMQEAKSAEGRVHAVMDYHGLEEVLMRHPPSSDRPMEGRQFRHFVCVVAKALLWAYGLFIPFAFVCLFARLSVSKQSVADEIVFGWKRLLFSGICWIVGMANYPKGSAVNIRRRRLELEYAARTGKRERDFTRADWQRIEQLVLAPKAELVERLNAIRQLPWHALLKVRMTLAISIVAGYLFLPLSFARAETTSAPAGDGGEGTAKPAVTLVQPPPPVPAFTPHLDVNAFGQVKVMQNGDAQVQRVFLKLRGQPAPNATGWMFFNLANGRLMFAEGTVQVPGTPLGFRAGRIFRRGAFLVPAPDGERLIDGPAVGAHIPFFATGASAFVDLPHVSAELTASSDAEGDSAFPGTKNVQLSVDAHDLGPLHLQASVLGGRYPNGLHLLSSGSVALNVEGLHAGLIGVVNQMGSAITAGASGMVAYRAGPNVDLAVGTDWLAPAGQPSTTTSRAQVTLLAARDLFRLGIEGLWNSTTGIGSIGRLQFGF